MSRSIFDTVLGQPISATEEPSLLDLPGIGRDKFLDSNPQAAGRFGVGDSRHDWGIKVSDIPNLEKIRAAHQSSGEQFGAFLNQAIIGEIAGGSIEGIGYLLDLESYGKLLTGTEQEFGNWFSDIGKSMRTWADEATPIHVDPDQAKFAPNHWSWWMQNGKSVASTLSLMIPAAGAVKGISMVGKAMGAFQKISPLAKWATTGISQAAVSRHMENMMEASGVQKEMYDKGITKGMSIGEAKEYAAKAASKTYGLDWAMFLQDIPQYLLLNSAFGKATVGLAEKSISAAAKMGKPLAPIIKSKATAIALDMVGEGFEEGYQFIASEEAKYLADMIDDPNVTSSFDKRLGKYIKDGEFWTNVAMGALGAGVMQTAGKAVNNLIQGGDPQTRFVKEFGSKLGHAAQQVQYADIIGSESGKRAAITNLETALFTKAASIGSMDDAKEMIKRSANPSADDMANLGINPEDVETLQLNHEEILKHADEFEKLWEKNARKYDATKAAKVTQEEFLIGTYNEYKKDYTYRLSELKDKITNYNELSYEAQEIFGLSSQILTNQKRIDFQKKRLEDTKNPLSKKEAELANKLIAATEKSNIRLKSSLAQMDESRDEDTKESDNAIDIGGPYNLLEAKSDKDITGHSILEYKKLNEALGFADDTLKAAQIRLKEVISGKKEPKPQPIPQEDLNRVPESDDYVLYTVDGKQATGIVDYVNEDGDYVILPTTKWSEEAKYATKPTGESIIVSSDKVVLDNKQYIEEDIHDESISDDDIKDTVDYEEEDTSTAYLDISYMQDDGGPTPTVRNEELHSFLIDPNNSLDGVTAEMHIDTTSKYGINYFKSKGLTDVEIRRITNGKLTDNDIKTLFTRASIDTIPISITLVRDGKVLVKGGMFYHETSFRGTSVPAYITAQGNEVVQKYINNRKQKIRNARWEIVPNLLKGNEVFADTLRTTNGHYDNSASRGSVLERHGLELNDGRIAISRKNGAVYISNNNTVAGITSKNPGTPFAPTRKTLDGKVAWAKINPTKLTREHAEILWDAVVTRYSRGKGRLSPFPDDRVTGLTLGEVITMLTLFGERKTNPKHENNKGMAAHLANKAFFVNSARDLTFGSTTVNIHEDNIEVAKANKAAFIKWAMENKNYSLPIGIKPMGIEMNSPLKRTFKIGSWENKADENGNFPTLAQFLMSVPVDGKDTFAVVSDFKGFVRPNLLLGDNENAIKIRKKVDSKPKVPKETAKSKAKAKAITKAKKTPTVDSPLDIINLPVGSEIYFMSPIVGEDNEVSEKTERILLGTVISDKKLGRVLDINPMLNQNTDKWQWLELDNDDHFKKIDELVSYLKGRPHIDKVLVDVSNTVEDKVQVEPIAPVIIKIGGKEGWTIEDFKVAAWQELRDLIVEKAEPNEVSKIQSYAKKLLEVDKSIDEVYNLINEKFNLNIKGGLNKINLNLATKKISELVASKSELTSTELEEIENEIRAQEYSKEASQSNQSDKDTSVNIKDLTMPSTNDTVDDLEDILGMGTLMEAEFSGEIKSVIDLKKELAWFHKRFGDQNVKASSKILTLAANGRKAFGIFTADSIYVYTGAPEGTLYHEAFHRVFLGYLSEQDRERIYKAARKQFNMPNATNSELSEALAEDFRAYKLSGTKPKSRTIGQFFTDLLNFIITYFTGNTKLTSWEIDRLYDSINRGQYRYSSITAENLKKLENTEAPMAIEIRKTPISVINNYHELDKIIKFLTAVLIQTNEIDNLNDIGNIQMSKMWDHIDTMVTRLENSITNTDKLFDNNLVPKEEIEFKKNRLQVSRNLLEVLNVVRSSDYSPLFVEKISDMLSKLNVKRIQNEDNELFDIVENNYKAFYDRASYEINSKDNLLASVKFLIATLPKTGELDPHIGISEFVDFNEMWNSLMHNMYDIDSVEEMMDRLNDYSDQYPYQKLIEKLDADKTGLKKQQLRTAVQKHRHSFVNFLLTIEEVYEPFLIRNGSYAKDTDVPTIEITNADVSRASVRTIKEWNLFFRSIAGENTRTGVVVDSKLLAKIADDYTKLDEKVNKEFGSKGSFSNREAIVDMFMSLLNRIGMNVDIVSIEEYIDNRSAENKDDALFQTIHNDFSYIFSKVKNANDETFRNIFADEKYPRLLAEAYVTSHPEKISDIILGPGGNQYYVYSQNSHVSDTIRRIRNDKSYLEDHLNKVYNDNSYYGAQLLANDDTRKGLEILTFAMFSEKRGSGSDYLNINPIEDYVFKVTAMANGLIPFPTMADKKTYYLLKGVQPLDFKYKDNGDGTYSMPPEAIDTLLGYAKSEKNRIERAIKTRDEYNAAKESGNEERIKLIERTLVEGYHYTIVGGKKILEKGSAYEYHNFPSFNREGFNFDVEARDAIRKSIIDNVRAELEYAESLGIIYSTDDINTGKKNYNNRLLDNTLISKYTKDYGTPNMAIRNIIASHFVNTIIANTEVEKLFLGDPAFFKLDKDTKRVVEDRVKRSSVLTSTGDNFSNNVSEQELNDSTFNIVTLNTQKYPSINYKKLESLHTASNIKRLKKVNPDMAEDEIERIAKEISFDTLKAYRNMDQSDGQAWISPEMYRSLSIRLGEWSDTKQVAFDLLQENRELTLEEEKEVLKITFQPLKLVYFALIHDGDLAIPTYHKASFATVFRSMIPGEHGDRQIVDMLDRMEGKGKYVNSKEKVDMFVMDSATKVGVRAKNNLLDDNLESIVDLSNVEVYQQPYYGLRRQLVTDAHDVDRTKTGTQFLKIALANLQLNDKVYTVNNELVDGTVIRDMIFKSLTTLSNRGREEIEKRLGYENGKIDKAKLIDLLSEDAKKSNASDNLIDAISMLGDEMYLELDSLTDHKWIQSRIISLISKHTVDINLPGNQLIQFSNLGIRSINKQYTLESELAGQDKHVAWIKGATDDLQFMTLEDGKVVPMGCLVSINLFKHVIPNYDNISYADKVKFLENNPEIMGYRIPTQGQNSLFMLKVMGVYPETIGDTITLPSEFTALTGSDFDIDKAYVVRYNYITKGNKLEKVRFIDGDTNDESVLKKIYKEAHGKLLGKLAWLSRKADGENLTEAEIDELSQYVELTDSVALENALIKMRTKGKYDLKAYENIKEIAASVPTEEEFIAKNKGKNIYDVNSRKAVENKLIDAFFAVMKSEAHFLYTSAPLGNLTDKLKNRAKKIRAISEKQRVDMYYSSPRFNEEVKHTYSGGKDGIGPFALNNVHHILAQLAGLEMKGSLGDVMHRSADNRNIDMSQERGKDDIVISNWLSALIDAHVDVAKDPYIMDLNVNSFTYNVIALLLRGGAGEISFDFLAQPILRELAKETLLTNERNNVLTKKLRIKVGLDDEGQDEYKYVDAKTYVEHKWSNVLTEVELEEINKLNVYDVFNGNLESDLSNDDMTDKEFVKRQILVFKAFDELKAMGEKLNTLVQASQIDTKKFGSNITELRVFINKIRKTRADDAFVNLDKILPYDPDSGKVINIEGANFLGTYAANAIKFSLDVLGEVSIYGTPVFEDLFNHIIKITGNQFTTDPKFVNILSDEIFTAMISKFFTSMDYAGINDTKLKNLLDRTIQNLIDIKANKNGEYDDLQDNMFIKYIHIEPTTNTILPKEFDSFITVPMKSVKDKLDKDNMINSFKELLKYDDAKVRGLARQLFYYSYYTSGFRPRIYSFYNLLPNELFKEITIKDPSDTTKMVDKSYNEMIKEILRETKDLSGYEYTSIIDEVIINNHDNDNLIKLVNRSGIESTISEYKGKTYSRPIAVTLTEKMSAYLLLGYNHANKSVYRPMIKVRDTELGHIILRYIGTVDNKPVYVTQNMRSYNARGVVLKEFNLPKSIIPIYNELNVITTAMEDEFMIRTANGKDYQYVPKTDQLVAADTYQLDEDDKIEPVENTDIHEVAIKSDRIEILPPSKLSTKEDPLVIFVDGSDMNKQSADNAIGYGAWFNFNGKDYGLSGTKSDVDHILSQFKGLKMSNPTMEMLGLLEVLKRFKTTNEHLLIRQDYSGAVNYAGVWEHSEGSEQRANKPWVAKEPYIKYIVDEINKAIAELETNGGSVRILWVPGHIDNSKVAKYPGIFVGEDGTVSQAMVDRLTKGNDSADVYAKMQESTDDMNDLLESKIPDSFYQTKVQIKDSIVIGKNDYDINLLLKIADIFTNKALNYSSDQYTTVEANQKLQKEFDFKSAIAEYLDGSEITHAEFKWITENKELAIQIFEDWYNTTDEGGELSTFINDQIDKANIYKIVDSRQLDLFSSIEDITDEQADERKKECE